MRDSNLILSRVLTNMRDISSEYKIIKGSAGNEELDKYRLCFLKDGAVRSMQNLNWLHHRNLLHTNLIYYAMKNGEMAGIYTALPLLFRIDGVVSPALQSVDTLTDIDHRGNGLFIKLANSLYGEAVSKDFKLIYGFPNPNSAPGFYKKLQWRSFGEVPFLIKPLNPFYFLKKIFNRKKHTTFAGKNHIPETLFFKQVNKEVVIRPIKVFDEQYNDLWNLVSENIRVCAERSAAYMNWRYIDKPGEHYYRMAIYVNDRLSGIIVFSLKHKHGGLVGTIMELIYDPKEADMGKHLLKFASAICRKHKVDVILAWCLSASFNYEAYKLSGYYRFPEKIRPQKLFLGVKLFDESMASLIYNLKNWYISYSDSDTA